MSYDINSWKVKVGNVIVGQVQLFESCVRPVLVVTSSLNGKKFVQTVGSGVPYYKVSMVSETTTMKNALNTAVAVGSVITCIYKGKTYKGTIVEELEWENLEDGATFTTSFELET